VKSVEEIDPPVNVVGAAVGRDSAELLTAKLSVERLETEISLLTNTLVETEKRLNAAKGEADAVKAELNRIHNSSIWAFRAQLIRLFPWGTRRRRLIEGPTRLVIRMVKTGPKMLRRNRVTPSDSIQQLEYREWLRLYNPTSLALERMREQSRSWAIRPKISVVVLAFGCRPDWLKEAAASVVGQTYDNWELVIGCQRPLEGKIRNLLSGLAGNGRTKIVVLDGGDGKPEALNRLLIDTDGEFVAFLEPQAIFQPHAFHSFVEYLLDSYSTCDLVYSDEDKLLPGNERGDVSFKPDWSPALLLGWNYIGHSAVIRRSIVEKLGRFRDEFGGVEHHDLLLRVCEQAREVGHVADVLYTRRADAKKQAGDQATAADAITSALQRRGIIGGASKGMGDWYDIRLELLKEPMVDIIIPTRDRLDLLKRTVESIEAKSSYRNYRISIIDNDSRDPETLEWLGNSRHTVVKQPGIFSFSRMMNTGVAATNGDMLLFLNNDTEVIAPDWIEAMLEQAQLPDVGAVGCRLLFPDGSVQHEGTGLGLGHVAVNLRTGWRVIRELSAVTAAALMMRRDVFLEVRGFDEKLPVVYNDVDLCLRIRKAGYKVIFTPFAELYHYESASRGKLHSGDADAAEFKKRWGDEKTIQDPYMSPHVVSISPLHLRLNPYLRAGELAMSERHTAQE
jgi:GT2 family glycosyltransferase